MSIIVIHRVFRVPTPRWLHELQLLQPHIYNNIVFSVKSHTNIFLCAKRTGRPMRGLYMSSKIEVAQYVHARSREKERPPTQASRPRSLRLRGRPLVQRRV